MSHCLRTLACLFLGGAATLPVGCDSVPDADASIFEIRAASIDPMDGWTRSDSLIGGTRVWVSPNIVVDASGVLIAEPIVDEFGRNAVLIDLDDAATNAMEAFTTGWFLRPIAVFVDGRLATTPILQGPLSRKFIIAGEKMTEEQAEDLAKRLRESD